MAGYAVRSGRFVQRPTPKMEEGRFFYFRNYLQEPQIPSIASRLTKLETQANS